MNEIEKYEIFKEILDLNERVFKYEIDGELVYVKQREKNKKHIGHFFQGLLYKITKNPMLIPTVLSNNENEVIFEAEQIRTLNKAGISVPTVLFGNEDYFVMSDTGESLKEYMKANIKRKDFYIEKAIELLSELHSKSFAHGGSQIRNFILKYDKFFFISFEVIFPHEYIKDFQKRDILIFILSLQKGNFDPNVQEICDIYSKISLNKNIFIELQGFLLKFRWIKFLNSSIFKKIRMKDVRDFIAIIEKFSDVKKENK